MLHCVVQSLIENMKMNMLFTMTSEIPEKLTFIFCYGVCPCSKLNS